MANNNKIAELPGEQNSRYAFAEQEPPRRGRPPLISQSVLSSRFAELLGYLQMNWGLVGWDLQRANTLVSLRNAIARGMFEPVRSTLRVFIHEKTRRTSLKELSQCRKEVARLTDLHRLALYDEAQAKHRCEVALHVLATHADDCKIRSLARQREQLYQSAINELQVVREQCERKREELLEREAHFAQSQVLEFIRSKRYAFTPASFAKAMAGLPWITWRQSASRCVNERTDQGYAIIWEKYQLIRKGLATIPLKAAAAVEHLKGFLLSRHANGTAADFVRDEWHFLHCAINASYAEKQGNRAAIPYAIFAEYQRRASCRSPYDQIMQEENRLSRD